MSLSSRIQRLAADVNRTADGISVLRSFPPYNQQHTYVGGDPSSTYHEVRNYLLRKGIDTRIFTYASIPLPAAFDPGQPHVADRISNLDNSFFFEFRKVATVELDVKVNTLVMLGRVFFDKDQCSNEFHVQFVPNHFGDCVFQLNSIYNDVIDFFRNHSGQWAEPCTSTNRVMLFEKSFTTISEFQKMINQLLVILKKHDVAGSNLLLPLESGM